jgi:hypothetical protein
MIVFATVIALSTVARADDHQRTAVDARTLPKACAPLAWIPQDARTVTPVIEAYTSIAGCIVRERTRGFDLHPDSKSVDQLDIAVAPALALLDSVIETGDATHQIIALHAKADIYQGLTTRLRNSMRANPDYAQRKEVDRLTVAWNEHARDANLRVTQIAAGNPGAVRGNPVVTYAVQDAQRSRTSGVASR